jgi:hypothetical protein
MKMGVFRVVALCSLVEVYQRFGGPCCLHHQGDEACLLSGPKCPLSCLRMLLLIHLANVCL